MGKKNSIIPFNIPLVTGNEEKYLHKMFSNRHFSGDGFFTRKCNHWLEDNLKANKAMITTSCTHALEMSSILSQIKEGDEIIMSSFTFVSSANAFALRGAKIVFVDIRPDTMNINEELIESAITNRTKAILPMHYAGVGCEMDTIVKIAKKFKLLVIEDAAQCLCAKYKGQALGTIGDLGTFSFHSTKNIHCGEGGALLINNKNYCERAEIIIEKGTNRSKFLRGEIDKYTWVDIGSSYLPSELNASFLYAQLAKAMEVTHKRIKLWNLYYENLKPLYDDQHLELPQIPKYCEHNGHIFYIKCKNIEDRQNLINYLRLHGINSVFHYIPLHSAQAGKKLGCQFVGEDQFTTKESERLLRLPLYYTLSEEGIHHISEKIKSFYVKNRNPHLEPVHSSING